MESFKDLQSFYKSTLSQSVTAAATTIPVQTAPDVTTGFLVLEPKTSRQEIVLLSSVSGTDLTVVRGLATSGEAITDAGNGVAHPVGSAIQMTDVHYYIKLIQAKNTWAFRGSVATSGDLSSITNAEAGDLAVVRDTGFLYYYNGSAWATASGGSTPADASTSTKGITKLSVAPASATNPIAVGDNDPRVPTSDENDALAGESPDSSNLFITQSRFQKNAEKFGTTTGSSNAYVLALSPALAAYTDGQVIVFEANHANTGAATLNVNGLGAKSIKKGYDATLASGDILANQMVVVVYDATNDAFQMQTGLEYNRLLDKSDTTVDTGGVETLYSITVAADELALDNGIKLEIPFTNLVPGAQDQVVELFYGSTTIASLTLTGGVTGIYDDGGMIVATLFADGSASAQFGFLTILGSGSSGSITNRTAKGTATEDSTGALTLGVRVTNSQGSHTILGGYAIKLKK